MYEVFNPYTGVTYGYTDREFVAKWYGKNRGVPADYTPADTDEYEESVCLCSPDCPYTGREVL